MDVEEQVTNLELSKKLKELGFEQEADRFWCQWSWSSNGERHWCLDDAVPGICPVHDTVSAYDVSELCQWIKKLGNVTLDVYPNQFCARMSTNRTGESDTVLANACAKLLIFMSQVK